MHCILSSFSIFSKHNNKYLIATSIFNNFLSKISLILYIASSTTSYLSFLLIIFHNKSKPSIFLVLKVNDFKTSTLSTV